MMNGRTMKHGSMTLLWKMLFTLFIICFGSCKDDKDVTSSPYDPNQPVEVTKFTPEEGGARTRMIIYGSNFGTDIGIISIRIGGKSAAIVSAKGNSIYCITPEHCYEGTIEVKVGEQVIVIPTRYKYRPQMVVTTLCGTVDEDGNGKDTPDASFADCGKIDNPTWFSFDPENRNILYLSQDNGAAANKKPLRVLDLAKEHISTMAISSYGIERLHTISWTKNKDMVISTSKGGATSTSNIILKRKEDGSLDVAQKLTKGPGCYSSMIDPRSGEIVYYQKAKCFVYKYDFIKNGYENNVVPPATNSDDYLFALPETDTDISFVPHPDGKYVYIIMHQKHYILRSNYDDNNRLVTPYIVCGKSGDANYQDLAGTRARLNTPGQGVFVFNKDYESQGKEDCYDFYFTDSKNHCIRVLTPEGVVSTFAGRGSAGVNVWKYGYINGAVRETARFNTPVALAYDKDTETFYVGDVANHRIRKIAMEEMPEELNRELSDESQSNKNIPDEARE